MKRLLYHITAGAASSFALNLSLLAFRVAVSLELMIAHGLKKVGIGVSNAEQVPNPLHLPELVNQVFATAANLFFPLFVIVGLFTRLAVLPVLAVTLTGYFVLHWNGALPEKDMPFMYSLAFLLLLVLGAGKYSLDFVIFRKSRLEKPM